MNHADNSNGNSSDVGYEAEWAGGQTVGEWRESKTRRKGPLLESAMKAWSDTKDTPGDEMYDSRMIEYIYFRYPRAIGMLRKMM